MKAPPLPPDEAARLDALQRLHVLDTPPEERFDRITRIASRVFDTPIALVSLVDGNRQWFKSRQGLDATETPREISFCGHAILGDSALVVADALADPRFATNPLVTAPPDIRFYAGHPLHSLDRYRVGTLCIIDRKPHEFSAADRAVLADLAALAEAELNLITIGRVQSELEEARLAAEFASAAKTRFLADMSHELRTPLNAMIGFSRLLAGKHAAQFDEKATRLLHRLRANSEHLLELINGILDISRVEAGRIELSIAETDVGELVRDTVALLEGRATPGRVTLLSELPPDIPLIQSDRSRLRQVLINLVGNAIKFTDEGNVTVRVVVRSDGEAIEAIEVRDTGIGIPEDQLPKMLEPFERAESATGAQREGTGLGLAISRSICRALGFDLELESEFGVGTIARIRMGG